MNQRAFVLLSGGIDSSTVLYHAVKKYGSKNTRAISIFYGQRHHKEIDAARQVAASANVQFHTAKLGNQPPSRLTDEAREIPNISYDDIEGVSPTYVPFRNGQLLSHITAAAVGHLEQEEAAIKAHPDYEPTLLYEPPTGVIYFGAHAEDAQGWAYPDCTPEFIGSMANAIYIGTYKRVRLEAPFTYSTKSDILRVGVQLRVPYELTWSCYKGGAVHCGVCPTCRARQDAFDTAHLPDPTVYERRP